MAKKNSILIETIGRIERVVETDKSYIPYIVSGEIDDINRFVKELEEEEQKISFSETTSQLDITQSKGRLTCKLSANILEKIEEDKEKVEELNFKKILGYGVKDIKFLKYNEKEYIIIKYRDGSKDIYFQGEILDIDGIK
jgi:MFS superfamily sulfate permease-like transporter